MSDQNAHPHPGDSSVDHPETVRIEPRSSWWFDRYDRGLFYVLLVGFPFFAALGLLVPPLLDFGSDAPMVAAETGQIEFPGTVVGQFSELEYSAVSATIYLEHPTTTDRLIGLALPVATVALFSFGSVLLFRITRAVERGYAFDPANVRRLRLLSVVVAAAGVVYTFGPLLTALALVPVTPKIDEIVATVSFGPLLAGFVGGMAVAMLSQAFSVGTDLTEQASQVI